MEQATAATSAVTGQGTLSGKPLKDVGGGTGVEAEPTAGAGAVKEMAETQKPDKVPAGTQQSALDWFVSAEPLGGADGDTTTVRLNVGGEDNPHFIDWTVKPIELDALRSIRKRANNSREARKTGNTDEFRVNLEIVTAATVEPNLAEAAAAMAAAGRLPNADPVEALRIRFNKRPGFITQLAGKILTASGFDEEDVQDKAQVQAAGNS